MYQYLFAAYADVCGKLVNQYIVKQYKVKSHFTTTLN